MNPYLEALKEELREECGEDICQADWDCFWDGLKRVDEKADFFKWSAYSDGDYAYHANYVSSYAQGTRADLPSIVKYAYAAIEENLK